MYSQPHRWLTPMLLHRTFSHVLSNMLLFVLLAYQLEVKYGVLRVAALWLVAVMGGALFSAAFEEPCVAVVGASGGVFGLIGLFLADLLLNFETIKRYVLRDAWLCRCVSLCCVSCGLVVVCAHIYTNHHRPILRCICVVALLAYFIATVAAGSVGVSHLSHVGMYAVVYRSCHHMGMYLHHDHRYCAAQSAHLTCNQPQVVLCVASSQHW